MDVSTREQWMEIVERTIEAQPRVARGILDMVKGLSNITDGFSVDQMQHALQTATRAERDGAGAAHPYLVLDVRGVEQGSVPLFPGGEPVLAGRKRDPGRLAPADQACAAVDPGHRVRLR